MLEAYGLTSLEHGALQQTIEGNCKKWLKRK